MADGRSDGLQDGGRHVEAAKQHVEARWSDERVEALRAGVHARARGRRRRRAAGSVLALVAVGALAMVLWPRSPDPIARPIAPSPAPTDAIRFEDGSIATPVTRQSRLVVARVSPDETLVELREGAGRFEVAPRPGRRFRVRAGEVTVTVLGTIFEVERGDQGVRVSVTRGRVAVEWPRGRRELAAGEQTLVGPEVEPEPTVEPVDAEEPPPPASEPTPAEPAPSARPRRAPSWQALAEQGEFDSAFEQLERDSEVLRRGDVRELLLAADAARLSGHPAGAVPYLQFVVAERSADPRAALAAFTLGRVQLPQLGRPREAAEAFARARALAPEGSLAADALAREVESWARAGQEDRARERALEYLDRYPHGLHAQAVRRHGALLPESP